ncbi:MAG: GNAT family N-acetyltransferase [Deltaproteobacteria bacterium]|nr:GNAT family N-acetyltransferase [Deltaproteobacteria bacterium]
MNQPFIRSFERLDTKSILELFQLVFGCALDERRWQWQFEKNPFAKPIIKLAHDGDKLIGHYSLVPLPFWRQGKTELAAFSIHSMVHPQYQRQGILKKLAFAAEEDLAKNKIAFSITFLNDNSFPVYTNNLGWQELDSHLPIFITLLKPEEALAKILPRALATFLSPATRILFRQKAILNTNGIYIREVDRFDERVDLLWSQVRQSVKAATERNASYLNWRFCDNPSSYKIFFAEQEDRLLGFVTVRDAQKYGLKMGYVAEMLFDPQRPLVGQYLAEKALHELKENGCCAATAMASMRWLQKAFVSAGMRKLPSVAMPHGMHLCFKQEHSEGGVLLDRAGWFYTWSDHDVV